MSSRSLDLSVILPFSDHEDTVGAAVGRIASHLRDWPITFEILCVDEDSGDNSRSLLALCRSNVPELCTATSPGRGQGFATGAAAAHGRILWLTDPVSALAVLPSYHDAFQPVAAGDLDAAVMAGRFAFCRRARCTPILASVRAQRGLSAEFARRFARRARARKLSVEISVDGEPATTRAREGSLARLFQALMPLSARAER